MTNFLPNACGVVFGIKEQDELSHLTRRIEAIDTLDFYPRMYSFRAHLTIAEFIGESETKELTRNLNNSLTSIQIEGVFDCKNISYLVPDDNFSFNVIHEFEFSLDN